MYQKESLPGSLVEKPVVSKERKLPVGDKEEDDEGKEALSRQLHEFAAKRQGQRKLKTVRDDLEHLQRNGREESGQESEVSQVSEVQVGGDTYFVEEVSKQEMFPQLGYAYCGRVEVRGDLPEDVKKAVIAHEVGHINHDTWNELAVIGYGFAKEPVNSVKTVWFVVSNKEQRDGVVQGVLGRFRRDEYEA